MLKLLFTSTLSFIMSWRDTSSYHSFMSLQLRRNHHGPCRQQAPTLMNAPATPPKRGLAIGSHQAGSATYGSD